MDDSLLRARPKSTLLPGPGSKAAMNRLEDPDLEADGGPWDEFDPLPHAGTPYTAAYARPSNKPETVLHVLLRDGFSKGYAWSNFDSVDTAAGDKPGNGPVIILRFAGLAPTELWIAGTNSGKLLSCLGRQRIGWIRELPSKRGFEATALGDKAEIITSIDVRPWKPERAED
jgi:hypothetical protein